jgi:hypothetical protein
MESVGANFSDWNNDINHKFLSEDIYNTIILERDKIAPKYKIFTKTSCAASNALGKYDYNLNFAKKNKSCVALCPNGINCAQHEPIINQNTYNILEQAGLNNLFEIEDGMVKVKNNISQETKSFITQTTALRVFANITSKSDTERLFNERNGHTL